MKELLKREPEVTKTRTEGRENLKITRHGRGSSGRLIVALGAAMLLGVLCDPGAARGADVTIDGNVKYQTIEGWAITHYIEWLWEGPTRYPIPEQQVMNQIKRLGIDHVQIYDHTFNPFMEITNDDNDPYNFNWSSYNAQFGSHAIAFERMKEMQNAELTFAPAPYTQPAWLCDSSGNFDSTVPNAYAEVGEYWTALCIYARDNYQLNIPYITLQIEPNWYCNWTAAELRDGIKAAGARLRQEGFDTMILAPDAANADGARTMSQTILSDPVAKSYMKCVAYHPYDDYSGLYGPDRAIPDMTSLAQDNVVKNSGLPLWMTEWAFYRPYGGRMGDWVDTNRLALDFAKMVYNTHVYGNTTHYTIWASFYDWGWDVDGNGAIEREGIFGPGVTDGELNLKKYGHTLSQYTKYVRPGCERIEAVLTGASNVFVTAYTDEETGRFALVLINKNTAAHSINVDISNIPGLSTLDVVCTSETLNSADMGQVSVVGGSFSFTLPKQSVTTFFVVPAFTLTDFAVLSEYWLENDCGICGGADLTGEGDVGMADLQIFVENWLEN